jgi:hypothetical protein
MFFPLIAIKTHFRNWGIFAVTLLFLYSPFLLQHGNFGGLNAFVQQWEYNSFGYGIIVTVTQSSTIAKSVSIVMFGCFYVWYLYFGWMQKTSRHLVRGDLLFGVFFLLAPVINPWYLIWMMPFSYIYPSFWGWTAAFAVSLSYINGLYMPSLDLPAYHHPIWLRPLEFGIIIFALMIDLYWRSTKSKSVDKNK